MVLGRGIASAQAPGRNVGGVSDEWFGPCGWVGLNQDGSNRGVGNKGPEAGS